MYDLHYVEVKEGYSNIILVTGVAEEIYSMRKKNKTWT